jgi:hypothetical protein
LATVGNALTDPNHAVNDIVNVGPIADLFTRSPYLKRALLDEGASDHSDDGVVFLSPRTVNGKVATRCRLELTCFDKVPMNKVPPVTITCLPFQFMYPRLLQGVIVARTSDVGLDKWAFAQSNHTRGFRYFFV